MAEPVFCGECNAPMVLRAGRFGRFWSCTQWPACNGAHGAHADGTPKGTPADAGTRSARIDAHAAFDRLWRDGLMSRGEAYRWLQKSMGLNRDEAHIGSLTKAQCATVIKLSVRHLVEAAKRGRRVGGPSFAQHDDGTIVGFDLGFGPELAAVVRYRRHSNGSITILESHTWDPAREPAPALLGELS